MQNDKGLPKGNGTAGQYKRPRSLSQYIASQRINNLCNYFRAVKGLVTSSMSSGCAIQLKQMECRCRTSRYVPKEDEMKLVDRGRKKATLASCMAKSVVGEVPPLHSSHSKH